MYYNVTEESWRNVQDKLARLSLSPEARGAVNLWLLNLMLDARPKRSREVWASTRHLRSTEARFCRVAGTAVDFLWSINEEDPENPVIDFIDVSLSMNIPET